MMKEKKSRREIRQDKREARKRRRIKKRCSGIPLLDKDKAKAFEQTLPNRQISDYEWMKPKNVIGDDGGMEP